MFENQVFSGLISASLVTYVLYTFKEFPRQVWQFLTWRFTCELHISSENGSFHQMTEWLSSLDYMTKCRRLRFGSHWDDHRGPVSVLSPGLGMHLIWYHQRPILVKRSVPTNRTTSWGLSEDLHVISFGKDPEILLQLVEEVRSFQGSSKDKVDVFAYRKTWKLFQRKDKRLAESVILPSGAFDRLLDDVRSFLEARAWYKDRGVPYRRGYLLDGSPGNGKTTLVHAVASHFNLPVYALNLGSLGSDDELVEAVCETPERAILLIEDIDAAKARPQITDEKAEEKTAKGISLSALLNVIDGFFAKDGRLLFMTTNYPDRLDVALKRRGRVDYRISLGPLEAPEVLAMCSRFLPAEAAREFSTKFEGSRVTAADLQEELVLHVRGGIQA